MDNFNSLIHHWYSLYKRDLPWRDTQNPYCIWLSEIILQQTRIEQGRAYYMSFIGEFPTISDLASASEDKVLKLWQGLGYYSRARNLHFTARYIAEHFNGKFPEEYRLILSLKGIGEYTAAAIASISFNQEYPAVDGNVYRVLSRFYGISDPIDTSAGKKIFVKLATELIKGTDPGMHNQALMEFGALQCTPQKPDCVRCPLHERCYAFANKKTGDLPVKLKKTTQRHRYFNYFEISHGDSVWLKKRVGKDIWKNLFEFPMIETSVATGFEELMAMLEVNQLMDADNSVVGKIEDWKIHLLTHQKINYRIIKVCLLQEKEMPVELFRVNKKDIFNFAVPKLLEKYLIRNIENG